MPRKKKEKLVHFDIDSLSKQTEQKGTSRPTSLGETLRAKREKKKLSIEDIARKLCIKEVYIKALEDGHYYAFPSRVYGIAFLRTYAKFLGLDSDLMVAEFHAETSDIKEAPIDMPIVEKHLSLPTKKFLKFFALVLLIFVILWFTVAALWSSDLFSRISKPSISISEAQETEVISEQAPFLADETDFANQSTSIEAAGALADKVSNADANSNVAAFIARDDVWVRLYNKETKKVILDKEMHKNDSFVPESQLVVLEISTGRENALELYKKGVKVKTFGQEKNRSLAEFAD